MKERDTPLQVPRGAILDPSRAARALRLRIHPPLPALQPWVHHHWFIDWDVSEPYTQSVLGRPCGNVVVDDGRWMLSGPSRHRFDRRVEGRGMVYGTQFRPASTRGFLPGPARAWVDERFDVAPRWQIDAAALDRALRSLPDDEARVALLSEVLLDQSPVHPPDMDEANRIVELLEGRPDLTRTDQLAHAVGRTVRSLQRLLSAWVGLSPKQLVRRFRLQEASARLTEGESIDLAGLAYSLGYADQAHFSRDFKRVVGLPPSRYAARQAGLGE